MTRKVYISCPSAALDVAREAMATARAMGWEVVGDWTESLATHGSQGVELSDLERERIVAGWWEAIGSADRIVAIEVPGVASDGCGYEAAVADSVNAMWPLDPRPGDPLERVVVPYGKRRLIHTGWRVARTVEEALR